MESVTACLTMDAAPSCVSMFMVDEETAAAIRRAWDESGELSAVIELRLHFPLITDGANARRCVRAIVGWAQPPVTAKGQGPDRREPGS